MPETAEAFIPLAQGLALGVDAPAGAPESLRWQSLNLAQRYAGQPSEMILLAERIRGFVEAQPGAEFQANRLRALKWALHNVISPRSPTFWPRVFDFAEEVAAYTAPQQEAAG